ncbi:MAG: hypothetical protein HKN36_06080 [Hellea sp.]|nr:hypothetical protein [Hellea sp.]
MTQERLENHYLSLWYWVRYSILPAFAVLLIILLFVRLARPERIELDKISAISGFFALYFIFIRGGHIYMIRTIHQQLKTEYAGVYPKELAKLPDRLKMRQIGASLARIKADLFRRQNKPKNGF